MMEKNTEFPPKNELKLLFPYVNQKGNEFCFLACLIITFSIEYQSSLCGDNLNRKGGKQ